ncbi:hypothetical protein BV898_06650, partial [Hypsibius exemplaris]
KGNNYFRNIGSVYFEDYKSGRNSADANYEAVNRIWKNLNLCEPNVSIEVANFQQMKGPRRSEGQAVLYTHKNNPVPIFIELPYLNSAPDDKDRKGGRNSADLDHEALDRVRKNPKMCEPNFSIEVSN